MAFKTSFLNSLIRLRLSTTGFMARENIQEAGVCVDEKVTYLTTDKDRRQRGRQEARPRYP